MDSVVAEIEQRLEGYAEPVEVAVLGCAVNGIGEASHADFGIAGAKDEGLIFAHGKPLRKVPAGDTGRRAVRRDRQIARSRPGRGRRGQVGRGCRVAGADRGGKRRRADARRRSPQMEHEAAEKGESDQVFSTRRHLPRPGVASPGPELSGAGFARSLRGLTHRVPAGG